MSRRRERKDVAELGSQAGFSNVVRAFRIPNYRVFATGNFISQIGYWIQRVAQAWLTWQLTHSGTWLGIVAASDLIPNVVISPFAGALADRVDRIRVIRLTQIAAIIQAWVLAILTYTGAITIEELFLLIFGLGFVNAFNQPARLALIPSLVDTATLPSAVAINSLMFNIARFIGPAIAGLVIAESSVSLAFVLNACSYVVFSWALSRVNVPSERLAPRRHFLRQSLEGYVYAVRHPGIGQILVLFSVTTVGIRGFNEMFPGFADVVFHRGAQALAWLTATMGLGAIVGGIRMIRRSGLEGLTRLAVNHTLIMSLAVLAFGVVPTYWMALVAVFFAGLAMTTSGISAQTLVQTAVDPVMRGRVMAFYGMVFRAGPALGALIAGWFATRVGFHMPIVVGAIACVAAWGWAWLRLGRIERALEPAAAMAELEADPAALPSSEAEPRPAGAE
ncbi:MAG TPA: MFS transporter [Stellaceae bacterium]|nr:MFS transporter [Stellaceae bacterium]